MSLPARPSVRLWGWWGGRGGEERWKRGERSTGRAPPRRSPNPYLRAARPAPPGQGCGARHLDHTLHLPCWAPASSSPLSPGPGFLNRLLKFPKTWTGLPARPPHSADKEALPGPPAAPRPDPAWPKQQGLTSELGTRSPAPPPSQGAPTAFLWVRCGGRSRRRNEVLGSEFWAERGALVPARLASRGGGRRWRQGGTRSWPAPVCSYLIYKGSSEPGSGGLFRCSACLLSLSPSSLAH